jgi:hypothetical protein
MIGVSGQFAFAVATALHALGTLRDAAGQGAVSGRRRIIVFDVNETLLNVGALAPQFERAFGDRAVLPEWFTNVVLYSQTLTIAGPYTDFGSIARACLDMTAQARGVTLQATDRDGIADKCKTCCREQRRTEISPSFRDKPRLRRIGSGAKKQQQKNCREPQSALGCRTRRNTCRCAIS